MPFHAADALLERARGQQAAIPSFDVAGGNLDLLHAACSALAETGTMAFLSSTPGSIRAYHGFASFIDAARIVSDHYGVHVAPHLDHATDVDDVLEALAGGFPSVMYDGSELPLDENIRNARVVVENARKRGATVEAELGLIGGKEDEIEHAGAVYADRDEARRFVAETGVFLFAPAIGTAHGEYRGEPRIDFDLAEDLARDLSVPLVLHGGSGLSEETLRRLVKMGFVKVNYATDFRAAFSRGAREELEGWTSSMKPQQWLATGREHARCFALDVLRMLA